MISIKAATRRRTKDTSWLDRGAGSIFLQIGDTLVERPIYPHPPQRAEMKYWRAKQLAYRQWQRIVGMGQWLMERREPVPNDSGIHGDSSSVHLIYYPPEADFHLVMGNAKDVIDRTTAYTFTKYGGQIWVSRGCDIEKVVSEPYSWLAARVHHAYQIHERLVDESFRHFGGFSQYVGKLMRPTMPRDPYSAASSGLVEVHVNGRRYLLDIERGTVRQVVLYPEQQMRSISL
jgi:hypothetical protein